MNKILKKELLTDKIHMFEVEAPQMAKKARAGQFIILKISDKAERIPLTIADYDREKGTITIVFMEVGKSSTELATLNEGDYIECFAGPLGKPTEDEKYGTVICVGGGFAIAPIHAIAKAMKQAGNKVITIIGARTKHLLFWEDKIRAVSDEVIIVTDDGSCGRKALVTEPLKELLTERSDVKLVVAVGPVMMMKFCSLTTKPFSVKTMVSLNPIMIDGTGMCGCCRVSVGGKTRFACVDGPDFDGHEVDWDILQLRQMAYIKEEKSSMDRYLSEVNKDGSKGDI